MKEVAEQEFCKYTNMQSMDFRWDHQISIVKLDFPSPSVDLPLKGTSIHEEKWFIKKKQFILISSSSR